MGGRLGSNDSQGSLYPFLMIGQSFVLPSLRGRVACSDGGDLSGPIGGRRFSSHELERTIFNFLLLTSGQSMHAIVSARYEF